MEKFTGTNLLNFVKELPDDDSCRAYLAKYKWADGFVCPKCGSTKGCMQKGYKYYCYGCSHIETATANTLFHRVRFGLQKAFCMVFEMTTSSKSISSVQMAKRYGVTQCTAWHFMQKVRKAMQSSKQHPLSEMVHVDEFTVGAMENGKQGRSYDRKKKKAVIAVELTKEQKIKRVYIKSIEDYSAKSLTPIFEEDISKKAQITTDKWRGYEPLIKEYNIEQIERNKGKNFKALHLVIHQVKTWLIPVQVSKKYIENYFDEFCYRINRSQSKVTIWHNTIIRMLNSKPISMAQFKQNIIV